MRKQSIAIFFLLVLASTSFLNARTYAATTIGPHVGFVFPAPNYDPIRISACGRIASAGISIGLDTVCTVPDFNSLTAQVFGSQIFEAYILGWGLGVRPTHLYDFFSSTGTVIPDGNDNIHVNDSHLDTLVNNFRFGDSTFPTAQADSQAAQGYIYDHGYYFPMYSKNQVTTASNQTYSGYYNFLGYGMIEEALPWVFQNVHRAADTALGDNGTRPFTEGTLADVSGWSPLDTTANSVWTAGVYNEIFDSLLQLDPVTLTYTPWLASSYTQAPCTGACATANTGGVAGTQFDWYLRTNLTWNDNYAYTANATDLDWTIKLLKGESPFTTPIPLLAPTVSHLVKHTVVSPYHETVWYNTTSVFITDDANLPIYPMHAWSAISAFMSAPSTYEPSGLAAIQAFDVGTGPFMVSSYTAGTSITLTRNTHYFWGAPTAADEYTFRSGTAGQTPISMTHAPFVNTIVYKNYGSTGSTVMPGDIESQLLDLDGWTVPKAKVAGIQAMVSAGQGFLGTSPNFGFYYFAPNLDQQTIYPSTYGNQGVTIKPNPFANNWPNANGVGTMFRAALNHLIDRDTIVGTDCGGSTFCSQLVSVVPPVYGGFFNTTLAWSNKVAIGADYNPSKMNDTMNAIAAAGGAVFTSTATDEGNTWWHYLIPIPTTVTPVFGGAVFLIGALGAAFALTVRKYKRI